MCTQELIWCSCGHGEFLPIVKCESAEILGTCWTVVYGDRDIVLEMKCSYCTKGFMDRVALSANARPDADRDQRMIGDCRQEAKEGDIVKNENVSSETTKVHEDGVKDVAMEETASVNGAPRQEEIEDALETDWDKFFVGQDMWQYA